MAIGDNPDGSFKYSHSITWALVDPSTSTYHSHATLDHRTPRGADFRRGGQHVADGPAPQRRHAGGAGAATAVPLPDRLFEAACTVGDSSLHLQLRRRTPSVPRRRTAPTSYTWSTTQGQMAVDVRPHTTEGGATTGA